MNVEPEKPRFSLSKDLDLPAFGYSPQVALRQTAIAEIGVQTILEISKVYSPDAYQVIKSLPDTRSDLISNELLSLKGEYSKNFIGAVYWIQRIVEAEWTEKLEKNGLTIQSQEDLGAYCWRVLREDPELFFNIVDQLCGQDLGLGRSYFIYRPAEDDSRPFQASSYRLHKDTVRALCFEHNKRQGYGEYLRVSEYRNDDVIGYSIEHGTYRKGSLIVDSADQAIPLFARNIKQDLIFYNHSTKSIWISASPKDVEFYLSLLEKSLFGENGCFSEQMMFDTSFLRSENLGPLLHDARRGVASCVRLAAVVYKADELDPMGLNFGIKKKKECLAWVKFKNFNEHRKKFDEAFSVKLQIDLLENKKVQDSIVIQREKMWLGKHLSEEQVLVIFQRLGILKGHYNA